MLLPTDTMRSTLAWGLRKPMLTTWRSVIYDDSFKGTQVALPLALVVQAENTAHEGKHKRILNVMRSCAPQA